MYVLKSPCQYLLKKPAGILTVVTLNLYINWGMINVLKILSLVVYEHSMFPPFLGLL